MPKKEVERSEPKRSGARRSQIPIAKRIGKYQFTGEVEQQVESFKEYLKDQRQDPNTIRQKSNYAGYFLKWLETEHLQAENTRYNDLLNFVDYCRLEGKSKPHVNRIIASDRE